MAWLMTDAARRDVAASDPGGGRSGADRARIRWGDGRQPRQVRGEVNKSSRPRRVKDEGNQRRCPALTDTGRQRQPKRGSNIVGRAVLEGAERERRITAVGDHAQADIGGYRRSGVDTQAVQTVQHVAAGSSRAAVRMPKSAARAALIFMTGLLRWARPSADRAFRCQTGKSPAGWETRDASQDPSR